MLSIFLASRPALTGFGAALLLAFGSSSDHLDSTVAAPAAATVSVDAATTSPTLLQLGSGISWTTGEDTADARTGTPRPAMVNAVAGLGLRALRFPSGLYSNCYDWRLAVGPLARRRNNWNNFSASGPTGCYSWMDGDGFGTDEFMSLVARISQLEGQKVEPIITVNICSTSLGGTCGDGGYPPICPHPNNPDVAVGCPGALLAAHWVEYLNGATSTMFGGARAKFGHSAPYGVHWFEIGNETQISETPAAPHYSDVLRTYVRAMRAVDPGIGIIAQGTCICPTLPLVPLREATLMATVGSDIDAIAPHVYQDEGDSAGVVSRFLAASQAAIAADGGAGRVQIMPTEWAALDDRGAPVDDAQRWGDMRAAVNDATDWLAFLRNGVATAPFFSIHGGPFSMLHCSYDSPTDTGDRCAAPQVAPYQSITARTLRLLASTTGAQTMHTTYTGKVDAAASGDASTLHVDLVNLSASPLRVTVSISGATGVGTATLLGLSGATGAEDLARTRAAYPAAANAVAVHTLASLAGASQMTVTLPGNAVAVLTVPVTRSAAAASTTAGAGAAIAWWHGPWRIRPS